MSYPKFAHLGVRPQSTYTVCDKISRYPSYSLELLNVSMENDEPGIIGKIINAILSVIKWIGKTISEFFGFLFGNTKKNNQKLNNIEQKVNSDNTSDKSHTYEFKVNLRLDKAVKDTVEFGNAFISFGNSLTYEVDDIGERIDIISNKNTVIEYSNRIRNLQSSSPGEITPGTSLAAVFMGRSSLYEDFTPVDSTVEVSIKGKNMVLQQIDSIRTGYKLLEQVGGKYTELNRKLDRARKSIESYKSLNLSKPVLNGMKEAVDTAAKAFSIVLKKVNCLLYSFNSLISGLEVELNKK